MSSTTPCPKCTAPMYDDEEVCSDCYIFENPDPIPSHEEAASWYSSKFKVWLAILIFFPIGLYGLYKNQNTSPTTKKVVFGLFVILFFVSGYNQEVNNNIATSIKNGNLTELQKEIEKDDGQISNRIINGTSMLDLAVKDSTVEIVTYLASKNAKAIGEFKGKQYNAIYRAIESNKTEMVEALRSSGNYDVDKWVAKFEAIKAEEALAEDIKNGLAIRYEGDILRATKIQPNTYLKCISTTTVKNINFENAWWFKNNNGKTEVLFQRDERMSQLLGAAHIPQYMKNAQFSSELGNYSWYIDGGERMWVTYYRGEKYHQLAKYTEGSATPEMMPCPRYDYY